MPRQETIDSLVEKLETVNNKPLSGDERDEVERWRKGRALAFVVNTEGWDVIREMLQSYATQEIDRLLAVDPGNRDEVMAAHATAFAANRIYTLFLDDVQQCIASTRTPEIVRQTATRLSPVPPESL